MLVAEHPPANAEHRRPMPLHQHRKRRIIPLGHEPLQQFAVWQLPSCLDGANFSQVNENVGEGCLWHLRCLRAKLYLYTAGRSRFAPKKLLRFWDQSLRIWDVRS